LALATGRITPKISASALESTVGGRFLTKTLPTPDRRTLGSRCDHMMRHRLPRISV